MLSVDEYGSSAYYFSAPMQPLNLEDTSYRSVDVLISFTCSQAAILEWIKFEQTE